MFVIKASSTHGALAVQVTETKPAPKKAKGKSKTKTKATEGGGKQLKPAVTEDAVVAADNIGGGGASFARGRDEEEFRSPQDLRATLLSDLERRRRISGEWEREAMSWPRDHIEAAIARLDPSRDAAKVSHQPSGS